ncbi:MAG: hypothetical protein IJN43_18745 [Ruminococcus sp.]|nr:hypothetical protein [Ruminococcus sp.]
MRLIDADDYCKECGCSPPYGNNGECVNCIICDCPTIEAEPVRHGRWEKVGKIGCEFRCTNCQLEISMNGSARRPEEVGWNYCKGCGAKMDGAP